MIRHDYFAEAGILCVEASGELDAAQVADFLERLGAPALAASRRRLVDLSGLHASDGPDALFGGGFFLDRANADAEAATALFAPLPGQAERVERLLAAAGAAGKARVFADLSIARLWLGVPVFVL